VRVRETAEAGFAKGGLRSGQRRWRRASSASASGREGDRKGNHGKEESFEERKGETRESEMAEHLRVSGDGRREERECV
jgi:hypothetical protein